MYLSLYKVKAMPVSEQIPALEQALRDRIRCYCGTGAYDGEEWYDASELGPYDSAVIHEGFWTPADDYDERDLVSAIWDHWDRVYCGPADQKDEGYAAALCDYYSTVYDLELYCLLCWEKLNDESGVCEAIAEQY